MAEPPSSRFCESQVRWHQRRVEGGSGERFTLTRNPKAARSLRRHESLPIPRNPHTIPEKFRAAIGILPDIHENASLKTELANDKHRLTVAEARLTLPKVALTIAKTRHASAQAHLAIDLSHLAGHLFRLTHAEVRRAGDGSRLHGRESANRPAECLPCLCLWPPLAPWTARLSPRKCSGWRMRRCVTSRSASGG